ncbi:hypothetical protein KPL35_15900 [Clostridium sp. CF011]|uniref:hypothetical protein n=1 Tax=Clostridium sp. CF011 TaxID=2843318 RepID=UPI001C0D10A6|nr:hypothetical protein [Clostridium sp. CF011]MBU3093542.1 hypothetical protein [Clostridium sp. CF011]WAG71722.1 hypothetical protein LL036_18290 [Clostridium sp. CF011]
MGVRKISKQEIKEKTEAVKKILNIKGGLYEEWLLEKQNEFINDNVSFLIEMASKNEPQESEDNQYIKDIKDTKEIKNNNI